MLNSLLPHIPRRAWISTVAPAIDGQNARAGENTRLNNFACETLTFEPKPEAR